MLSNIFILPAASFGQIKKDCHLPILLTKFADGEYLYEKQIKAIRTFCPNARIIYITGWHHEKIDEKLIKMRCTVINNLNFATKSIAYSVALALHLEQILSPFFFIDGNLLFNEHLLNKFKIYGKMVPPVNVIGLNREKNKKMIGLGPNNQFDFVFNDKLAKIMYINETSVFKDFALREPFRLIHEILSLVVKSPFQTLHLDNIAVEINKIKDVKAFNRTL